MCTTDLNDDGFMDIIALSQTDNSAFWYANNGSGIFSLPNYVVGLPYFSSREVQVIDIDGDTGGYNLQIAFSTGYLAGQYAGV